MSLPVYNLTKVHLLSLENLRQWVKTLPAEQQAEMKWSIPHAEKHLVRLLEEPLSSELIGQAVVEFIKALTSCIKVLGPKILEDGGAAHIFIEKLPQELFGIRKFFKDVDAADDAEWAFRYFIEITAFFSNLFLQVELPKPLEFDITEENFEIFNDDKSVPKEFNFLKRHLQLQVFILAILHAVEKKSYRERAEHLAAQAFEIATYLAVPPPNEPIDFENKLVEQVLKNFADKISSANKERDILRQVRKYLRENKVVKAREVLDSFVAESDFSDQTTRIRELLRPPVVRMVPGNYPNNISDNMGWIRSHSGEFKGQWVALDRGELLGASPKLFELHKKLDQTQLSDALFIKLD